MNLRIYTSSYSRDSGQHRDDLRPGRSGTGYPWPNIADWQQHPAAARAQPGRQHSYPAHTHNLQLPPHDGNGHGIHCFPATSTPNLHFPNQSPIPPPPPPVPAAPKAKAKAKPRYNTTHFPCHVCRECQRLLWNGRAWAALSDSCPHNLSSAYTLRSATLNLVPSTHPPSARQGPRPRPRPRPRPLIMFHRQRILPDEKENRVHRQQQPRTRTA